ncbi:MAG: leucine-rich repeat protein, partial [Clostridia bacterium]|nr:leucine-rich repeat protein [Clostridia bacterium]
AFRGCSRLTEITIPDGVKTIGLAAFNGCTSLTTLYIPESVTTVEPQIFVKCNTENITVYTESVAAVSAIGTEYPEVTIITGVDYCKPVYTEEELASAITEGESAVLMNSLKFTLNAPITVAGDKSPVINLNGFELQINTYETQNHEAFIVNGNLTVENGSIYVRHQSGNMGADYSTTAFKVTDGGILNLVDATVENRGGTNMNYAVILDNQGDATLNATDSEIIARYCAIAITNSGEGMNSVALNGTTVNGASRPVWIQSCNDNLNDERLSLDIYGDDVVLTTGKDGAKAVIFCGTDLVRYYDENGNEYAHDDTWDTTSDTSWYDENATEHILRTAEELAGFAQLVNEGNTFEGETVKLIANLDLDGKTWTPIGAGKQFKGTFDGYNKTVKNFALSIYNVNASDANRGYGAGLFGALGTGAKVENLTVANVVSNGRHNCVGVIAGYAMGDAAFENVHVVNADITAVAKVGGLIGLCYGNVTVTDSSVTESKITGTYNLGGLIGLVIGENTVSVDNTATDVDFV